MKLKDIQPHTVYAYYSSSRRRHDGYDTASQVYLLPDQIKPTTSRDKGKVYGMVLSRPWHARGKDTPSTWSRAELRLSHIQEPWPIFTAELKKEKEEAEIRKQRNAAIREENERKAEELSAYLKENKERLAAVGIPLPYWSFWDCKEGRLKVSLSLSDFQSLLERLEA